MRHLFHSGLVALIAGLFLFSNQLHAQQQGITATDAETYFQQVQREATEIMRAKELGRLTEWIDNNIADGTVFQASLNIFHNGNRKGFMDLSLQKEDFRLVGSAFAGSFRPDDIGDYSLEVRVFDVVPHGSGAATAKVSWTERFTARQPDTRSTSEQPSERESLTIESRADCNHLLQRVEGDRIAIGLSTCAGEVRF